MRKSQLIYQYVRRNGPVSKQDIVFGLKLSLPTVSNNLQYLMELGVVETPTKIENTGGRNAVAYAGASQARIAIGIYLTKNHMTAVSVDLNGQVIVKEKVRTRFNLEDEEYLKKIGELVESVKRQTDVSDEQLLGVGIAVQSLVSEDGEDVTYGMTLNFTGATRKRIAKYVPYRNRLFHDSEMSGHAEAWIDGTLKNAFYLSLNNSVGGSVIIDNKMYVGDTLKSGEIGHTLVVREGGEQCYCGRYGCFDTVCRATKLDEYTDGNLEEFFELLEQGDKKAAEMWDTYLNELAIGIHNIRMLFDSKVIIGGYIGAYIEEHLEELARRVDARSPFTKEKAMDYILPCKYKVESAAAGAALNYIDDFFESI